jgi:hypothetical protein
MSFTANGLAIFAAKVMFPRNGAWTATLACDAARDLVRPVTITLGTLTLLGTVVRSGNASGTQQALIIGGRGGLSRQLAPRSYRNVGFNLIVQDLLTESGEILSPDSNAAQLNILTPHWVRPIQRASEQLTTVATALGIGWRVQPNGSVRLGADLWKPVPKGTAILLDRQPQNGSRVYGVNTATVLPGVLFDGRRVNAVEYCVSGDAFRMTVWDS